MLDIQPELFVVKERHFEAVRRLDQLIRDSKRRGTL
jgi:hypothetical protein